MASTPAPPTELRAGRYVLVRPLGEGSQGETFEAVDKREGRLVAVKRFRVAKAKVWKDVELAEREAKTLASLDHPRLPKYVEHFEENGELVLVMELIEGESLAALKKSGHRASVREIEQLLGDASAALQYLHSRTPAVIHRDLKPANVLRKKDGSFAFVDFGAVRDRLKVGGGSTVVGTFGFMAPEQFQGRASATTDVYGIGATAITMLTGVEPEDLPHRGLAIDVAAAVPKGTPGWLVKTLEAMLAPDPEARAGSIGEALERGRAHDAARASKKKPVDERTKRTERRAGRGSQRRDKRRAEKAARTAKRARRRARGPFLPRLLARLAIMVAQLVVSVVVGLAVPLVLTLLSLVFGAALRRAAASCHRTSRNAVAAMWRASGWLAGEQAEAGGEEEEAGELRVADDVSRRVRVVSPEEAEREAMREDMDRLEDERLEAEAEAWAEERATREAERWEPPPAWRDGRARDRERKP